MNGILSTEFKVMTSSVPPSPEAKLAVAIVKNWYRTLLSLSRKKLRGKDLYQWQKETSWPDTENARFWVEGILRGNVGVLKEIRDQIVRTKHTSKAAKRHNSKE